MKKDNKGLSYRQKQALPYFLGSLSITDACKSAGISTKTFYEWVNNTSFGEMLEQEMELLRKEAVETLKLNLPKAARTLAELLDVPNESVRRLAAKDIIEHAHVFIDSEKMEERLKKLEKNQKRNVY
jgi:transposase